MSLTTAIDACDLRALIATHCGAPAARGLGTKGGTIHDPRPGMQEADPSFSVWRNRAGTWMWKKRGRNAGSGTAYTFLISLGFSGPDARAELLRFTGTPDQGFTPSTATEKPPVDVLALAQEALADLRAVTHRDAEALRRRLTPLHEDHPAAKDLARRGLWPPSELDVAALGNDLVFAVRGPTGRVVNFKRRVHGAARSKYSVMIPGHGTPAWCNPRYGQASRLLVIEGELNAAAAWRVIRELGLDFDVQGLPGTDTTPFLEGLDREVWVYADADESGERMRARIQDLAFRVGAPRVRQIPALAEGDFCDVLGRAGVLALADVLHAEQHQDVEPDSLALWPAQLEVQHAARLTPLLGVTQDYAGWPLMARS